MVNLNPLALSLSESKVSLSYPFSVLISNFPLIIVILLVAVKASFLHFIINSPELIKIFPKFVSSVSSGELLIASPSEFILNVPPLNSKYPSEAIAVLVDWISYNPFDFSKIIDTPSPHFIIFLHCSFRLNSAWFSMLMMNLLNHLK